jgi:chromate transporter
VIAVFLWLGTAGFGGPAAHLAMMEAEIVRRRAWLTGDEFLNLLGLTNLIPGPNSTEMAMALGYRRAGWRGLFAGGAAFIVPAAAITALLAWAYVRYGTRPDVRPWLVGLAPAVVGVIAGAAISLARPIVKDASSIAIAVFALAAALLHVNEIVVLLGGGVLGLFVSRRRAAIFAAVALLGGSVVAASIGTDAAAGTGARASLGEIGWFFLRTGSVLYGGGSVLAALLTTLVQPLGWMTTRELLDAVAAGQVTPGPVLTTATFVGFVLRGWTGAAVATVAIFLPAFAGVSTVSALLPSLHRWPWTRRFLDGVAASAWALVAATAVTLARAGLSSPASIVLALAACAASAGGISAGIVVLVGLAVGAAWHGFAH